MPIEYEYDEDKNLITTRFRGIITEEDMEKQARALGSDTRIRKNARELADLTDVDASNSEITPDAVQKMVDIDCEYREKYGRVHTAIVAPNELAFSLSRVFELSSDLSSSPFKVRVFTDRDEAIAWLDDVDKGGQDA